jgi:hypothetical protein
MGYEVGIMAAQSAGISAAMVVAFGIQQVVETFDSIASAFNFVGTTPTAISHKKAVLKLLSLVLSWFAAQALGIDVLQGTGVPDEGWLHSLITIVALAGGTEGVNSVLKYAGYAKENKKNEAASKLDPAVPMSQNLRVIGSK